MIETINRRIACCYNFFFIALAMLCFFARNEFYAQDTVSLKGVEVIAKKMDLSQIVESAWTGMQTQPDVKGYLTGLLATAEQEGMGASSPAYLKALKQAVRVASK
ncbi:MAG: hypothetical protein WCH21_03840, partial [Bacteroidota bacterium]